MTSQDPTFGIIGGTIWGNRGAESMLVTTIGQIRERFPSAHFVVFSYLPQRDSSLVSDPYITIVSNTPRNLVIKHFPFAVLTWFFSLLGIDLPDRVLSKAIVHLRRCNVLLDVSGISFADGREIFLPFNALNIFPAMLLKIPVVKLSQALGSFKNPITRVVSGFFLRRCNHIFARGAQTAEHLQALGLPPSQWDQAADIAFLYKPEYSLSSENEQAVEDLMHTLENVKGDDKQIVVLSPSAVVYQKDSGGEQYLERFLDIVQQFRQQRVHFVVIPNATRQSSEKLHNNDIVVIEHMRTLAQHTLTTDVLEDMDWVTFDINTASIRKIISTADVLITSRFHAMISSLCLSVPVVVIGWGHKYEEVLAEFDVPELALDHSAVEDLHEHIRYLLNSTQIIRTQLAQNLDDVRRSSASQFDYLERLLT